MEDHDLTLDLGMLCRFCDCDSYELPEMEGLTESQRQYIQSVCKLCVDASKRTAVNE